MMRVSFFCLHSLSRPELPLPDRCDGDGVLFVSFQVLPEFCSMFYFSLMKETLLVLTDTLHRSGFKFQTLIFMHLLRIVEFGVVHDASKGLDRDNVM